jgi:hypothetical protein
MAEQLKRILPKLESRLARDEYEGVKLEIAASCLFVAEYPESVAKIRKLVSLENAFGELDDPMEWYSKEFVRKGH